jgi:hypothetical protein
MVGESDFSSYKNKNIWLTKYNKANVNYSVGFYKTEQTLNLEFSQEFESSSEVIQNCQFDIFEKKSIERSLI